MTEQGKGIKRKISTKLTAEEIAMYNADIQEELPQETSMLEVEPNEIDINCKMREQ